MAHDVTEDSLIEELERALKIAEEDRAPTAMVAATVAKARITGRMIERRETGKPGEFDGMTAEELRAYIAQATGEPAIADSAQGIRDSENAVSPVPSPGLKPSGTAH